MPDGFADSGMAYLDFDLRIERSGTAYRALVVHAPAGEGSSVQFETPFTAMELENFALRMGQSRRASVRRADSPQLQHARTFGGTLFQAAFAGPVGESLQRSKDAAQAAGRGLRTRLRLDDVPELARIPWEFLYDPAQARFVCLDENAPLVRFPEMRDRARDMLVTGPLKILAVISAPRDAIELDVEDEWQRLCTALAPQIQAGSVQLDRLEAATWPALQRKLRSQWHVLHFIGHGIFDESDREGKLLFEAESGGSHLLSAGDLGVLLNAHWLSLVVLNACEGGRGDVDNPFTGVAQSLIRVGIPGVVAMQFEITDTAALTFARSMYEAIADGYPIDAALGAARKALWMSGNHVEWATPVLYLRSSDGRLFDRPAAGGPATVPVGAVSGGGVVDVQGGLLRLDQLTEEIMASSEPAGAAGLLARVRSAVAPLAEQDRDDVRAGLGLLASALARLGERLWPAGARAEALDAQDQATQLRAGLVVADARLEPELAGSVDRLCNYQGQLARNPAALRSSRWAIGLWRRLAGASPGRYEPRLADALHVSGRLLERLEVTDEAIACFQEAADIRQRAGSSAGAAFRTEAGEPDDEAGLDRELASLAGGLDRAGRTAEAVPVWVQLADLRTGRAGGQAALVVALEGAAAGLTRLGRPEEAIERMAGAVDVRRRLAEDDPGGERLLLAQRLDALGLALSPLGRDHDAGQAHVEAARIEASLERVDPMIEDQRLQLALARAGQLLDEAGDRDAALILLRRLAAADPAAWTDRLCRALSGAALGLAKRGQHDEAIAVWSEARGLRAAADLDDAPWRELADADDLRGIAMSHSQQGDPAAAVPIWREALAVNAKTVAAGGDRGIADDQSATAFEYLAKDLRALDDAAGAAEAFLQAAELHTEQRSLAGDTPAAELTRLGAECWTVAGEPGRAADAWRQAVELTSGPEAVAARFGLAAALAQAAGGQAPIPDEAYDVVMAAVRGASQDQGDDAGARPHRPFLRALASGLADRDRDDDAIDLLRFLHRFDPRASDLHIADLLRERTGRAIPVRAEEVKLRRRHESGSSPAEQNDLIMALYNLGIALADTGRAADAEGPLHDAAERLEGRPKPPEPLLEVLERLASVQDAIGSLAGAVETGEKVLQIRRTAARDDRAGEAPGLNQALVRQARWLEATGRSEEAETVLTEALELWAEPLPDGCDDPAAHLADMLGRLRNQELLHGNRPAALAASRRAAQLLRVARDRWPSAEGDQALADALAIVAGDLRAESDPDASMAALIELAEAQRLVVTAKPDRAMGKLASTLRDIAVLHRDQGDGLIVCRDAWRDVAQVDRQLVAAGRRKQVPFLLEALREVAVCAETVGDRNDARAARSEIVGIAQGDELFPDLISLARLTAKTEPSSAIGYLLQAFELADASEHLHDSDDYLTAAHLLIDLAGKANAELVRPQALGLALTGIAHRVDNRDGLDRERHALELAVEQFRRVPQPRSDEAATQLGRALDELAQFYENTLAAHDLALTTLLEVVELRRARREDGATADDHLLIDLGRLIDLSQKATRTAGWKERHADLLEQQVVVLRRLVPSGGHRPALLGAIEGWQTFLTETMGEPAEARRLSREKVSLVKQLVREDKRRYEPILVRSLVELSESESGRRQQLALLTEAIATARRGGTETSRALDALSLVGRLSGLHDDLLRAGDQRGAVEAKRAEAQLMMMVRVLWQGAGLPQNPGATAHALFPQLHRLGRELHELGEDRLALDLLIQASTCLWDTSGQGDALAESLQQVVRALRQAGRNVDAARADAPLEECRRHPAFKEKSRRFWNR